MRYLIYQMKRIAAILIFLFLFELSYSQSGQWTWMKGTTAFYGWLHKDLMGVEDSTYHPPALYMASNWTDDEGKLWLFGGLTYDQFDLSKSYFDWIWRFNPSTNNWACMKASNYIGSLGDYGVLGVPDIDNYPSARIAAGFWKDSSGMIWMFGGTNNLGAYNDMWKYDMNTNMWTWVKGPDTWDVAGNYGILGVPATSNNPPPRGESASWVDKNNDLWLFGGYWLNTSIGWEYYNDLWRYNIATNIWTWMGGSQNVNQDGNNGSQGIPNTANIPRSRSCNCSWTDTAGNFYLFGGTTFWPSTYLFDDVWKYNPSIEEWTWLSGLDTTNSHGSLDQYCQYNSQNLPISRTQSSCIKLNDDEVLMLGGYVKWGSASITRDVWKYRISTNEWKIIWGDSLHVAGNFGTQGIYSPTNDPRSRVGASFWKENEDTIWIYGGDYNAYYNSEADLWRYTLDSNCMVSTNSNVIITENSEAIIYPNPATDQVNIKFPAGKSFFATVTFKSSSGIKLFEKKMEAGDAVVDIANLPAGLYFIEISSADYRKVFKLVKE